MKKPTEEISREVKENGLYGKTIKKYSYAVLLCRKGESSVMAVRMDYYQNKTDVYKVIEEKYPNWKIKSICRLYEEDFDA